MRGKAYPADWKKPGYISSNGHVVRHYGRGFFIVTSASREGIVHFVDFEPNGRWPIYCQCEAFRYGVRRPCRHMEASVECILEPLHLSPRQLKTSIDRFFEFLLTGVPVEEPRLPGDPQVKSKPKREYLLKPYEASQPTQRTGLPAGLPRQPAGKANRNHPRLRCGPRGGEDAA